uniref:Uncharacterized protein n=1 Tax=Mustela putorius furo TaxID=9669 RepID=M3YEL7_MUSPF
LGGRRLTTRTDRGFPAPGNVPSSPGSGQDTTQQRGHRLPAHPPASPLARRLCQAGRRLHGNRTQTTYPGRLGRLPAEPGRCWTCGAGQEMSWDPAQGKGLPAKRKAPVISAGFNFPSESTCHHIKSHWPLDSIIPRELCHLI